MKKENATIGKNGIEKVSAKGDILSKLESINLDAISEKTMLNRSVWKVEILKTFKTDKLARRILRKKQFDLSLKVCKLHKINDKENLLLASKELENFYSVNLVDRNKFSNIDTEKEKGIIIFSASEISKKLSK